MLDDRVREVLARLEREDEDERARGLGPMERSRAVAPTTGRFLFSLVAPQADCEVLEIGGSRGYSSIWLGAGVRLIGGHVLSLEHDPAKVEACTRNVADAGLETWAELRPGDAFKTLRSLEDVFDVVFLDADDRLLPHGMEANVDAFDAQPEVALVAGSFWTFTSSGDPDPVSWPPPGGHSHRQPPRNSSRVRPPRPLTTSANSTASIVSSPSATCTAPTIASSRS